MAEADLELAPFCARQVRDMLHLLERWNHIAPRQRKSSVAVLAGAFNEAITFAGALKQLSPESLKVLGLDAAENAGPSGKPSPRARKGHGRTTLPLILHYHLFKNAGTSIDEILGRNFGPRWETAEFPPRGGNSNVADVEEYLREKKDILAFSSHTALLPLPDLVNRIVVPVIFVRHPLDRLRSAYEFERRQALETPGSRLAKEHDLAGYLRALLASAGNRQARNFQTHRLAFGFAQEGGSEGERAAATLERLEFVGLVEAFEESVMRLGELLKKWFPAFDCSTARKNASRNKGGLASRLAELKSEIGAPLYDELLAANAEDLRVFDIVNARYGSPASF